jgi:hypothetical protein
MRTLRLKCFCLTLALLVSLLGGLRPALACGPFFRVAVFSYAKHPDFPLEGFTRGSLGVLQPTYSRSYLYVAYRYMSGLSFTPQEREALQSLWRDRVTYEWEDKADFLKTEWLAARKKVKGVGPEPKIELYRATGKEEYDTFLNCPGDAFENATQTLAARIQQFGAESPEVLGWVQSQDKVFANCAGGETIPEAATSSSPLVRADRAYQIAASHFYSMKFDEARAQFEKIAADSSSPWRETARYLVARSLIRKASLGDKAHRNEALTEAETELKRSLSEIKSGPLHDSGAKLLNLVKMRLRPAGRLHELAQTLMQQTENANLKQDLWDYTVLLDGFLGDGDMPPDENLKQSIASIDQDDLSDWLRTFQGNDKESFEHALKKWQATSAQAWLIAALSKAKSSDASAASLREAANKITPNSPAYLTASFHLVRLMMESGDAAGARSRLDDLLNGNQASLPPSALNQFLHQRMLLASNLEEFLKYAQRKPASFTWDDDGREIPMQTKEVNEDAELKPFATRTLFDSDATRIMNEQFPLSLLQEAAQSHTLPDHLRKRVALAAWTRAVILNRTETAKALAPVLAGLAPEMRQPLNEYMAATTPQNIKAAGLYVLLKFPGTRPFISPNLGRFAPLNERDTYRDNWWCERSPDSYSATQEESAEGAESTAQKSKPTIEPPRPDFMSAEQRGSGAKERAELAAYGTAPNYLARQAVEWAGRSPNDPRVPEALHIAVMATRYGCTDEATGALSKAAWELLRRRYPNTTWAKKTPYWFKE